jgi:predicted nucleotidyltransferase
MKTGDHPWQRSPDFDLLVSKFDSPGVNAIVLMGSYARGNAGLFSDIDLVRFTSEEVKLSTSDGIS